MSLNEKFPRQTTLTYELGIEAHFVVDRDGLVALMAHRRSARVVFPTLAALDHPARRQSRIPALRGAAHAGRLALRVVSAVALLARHWIAREAMAVALAPSKWQN